MCVLACMQRMCARARTHTHTHTHTLNKGVLCTAVHSTPLLNQASGTEKRKERERERERERELRRGQIDDKPVNSTNLTASDIEYDLSGHKADPEHHLQHSQVVVIAQSCQELEKES